jgi:hypothetical protein
MRQVGWATGSSRVKLGKIGIRYATRLRWMHPEGRQRRLRGARPTRRGENGKVAESLLEAAAH